ncbi:MAG: glycyl-radical enzyme activating protein [Chloroflexi bacterium]|nr:glycyl-radical enzyme activating protein [Chloroflexota bacterium]
MVNGIVTNIQRFSIHDGPGIRTTVFFKGCNLRCFWCHNPETLEPKRQLQIFPNRCIGCGACFERCPNAAHEQLLDGRAYHRERCEACGRCAETCYAEALVIAGEVKTAQEVVDEVLRDKPFYETSQGGITLSGGEPLLQFDFAHEILRLSREQGLHTAIETALHFPWARVEAILDVTDLVMADVKLMDDARHRECTGVSNERILANLRSLAAQGKPLIIRTPLVPGVNDTPEEISAIAHFAAELPNLLYYELLAFHPMASGKYDSLGMDYRAREIKRPAKELMDELTEIAAQAGIQVKHS